MKITLPWPPSILSPNNRDHWSKKSDARVAHKSKCKEILEALTPPTIPDGPIPIVVTFHPPTDHKRDLDNMVACNKGAFDVLAKWLGVDDHRFEPTYKRGPKVKYGQVVVEV